MKKQIEKKFEHIVRMIERIEEYNAYLNDNKYYEGYGCFNRQLSFDVKIHNAWLSDTDVEDYIKPLNLSEDRRQLVLDEFNEERLNSLFQHWLSDNAEQFKEDVNQKESPYYHLIDHKDIGFYGRGGGHLCLGRMESFELEVGDTEVGNYPVWHYESKIGSYWSFNQKEVDEMIEDFKQSFGVTTMKEVYKQLVEDSRRGDLDNYYKKAVENQKLLEKLESDIKRFKKNASKYLKEFLQNEIENFIDGEFSVEMAIEKAEAGDYSQIDSFKEITSESILTNRNARVPTKDARIALTAITSGHGSVGIKIGNFILNRISVYPKDTYVKVGCHLFSLNQAKTAFSSLR